MNLYHRNVYSNRNGKNTHNPPYVKLGIVMGRDERGVSDLHVIVRSIVTSKTLLRIQENDDPGSDLPTYVQRSLTTKRRKHLKTR